MEVVAGELLGNLQAFRLGRVAHDVERVDEGVELLHREVVGDECLGAIGQTRDGELHGIVVQTAHLGGGVPVAAAHADGRHRGLTIRAVEAELEVGGREGGVGG